MSFLETIFPNLFQRDYDERVTIDARVENAVFDLKTTTRANIAATKLLDDLLHRSELN